MRMPGNLMTRCVVKLLRALMSLTRERVLFLVLLLVNVGFLVWWSLTSDQISAESGPIENVQLVVLFGAFALFSRNAKLLEGVGRKAAIVLCIACVYLFFREIDFRTMPVSDWLVWVTTGFTRRIIQGLVLLAFFGAIALNYRQFSRICPFLRSRHAWPYYAAFFLFVASKLTEEISRADHNPFGHFALPHGQFWEEMLELNADLMLLFGGVLFYEVGRLICERDKKYVAEQMEP